MFNSQAINTQEPYNNVNLIPKLIIVRENFNTADDLSQHFPNIPEIKKRKTISEIRLIEEFEIKVKGSKKVYIIDRHLFSPNENEPQESRIDIILDWFRTDDIEEVMILTGKVESEYEIIKKFDKLKKDISSERMKNIPPSPFSYEISFKINNVKCIHDRFAITDNELWHFGATVGGFHKDVNAASRGWNAQDYRAIEFFNNVWNLAENK